MKTRITHIILFFLEFFVIFSYFVLFVFYIDEFLNNAILFLLASGAYTFLRWLGTEERLQQNKYYNRDMVIYQNEKGETIVLNSKGKNVSIAELYEQLEYHRKSKENTNE